MVVDSVVGETVWGPSELGPWRLLVKQPTKQPMKERVWLFSVRRRQGRYRGVENSGKGRERQRA